METPRVYTLFAGPVQPGIAPGPGWWRATKAHTILMPAARPEPMPARRADASSIQSHPKDGGLRALVAPIRASGNSARRSSADNGAADSLAGPAENADDPQETS
jgi:hypothetical protein